MPAQPPFIVAAYIPCQTCNYPCVVIQRFDHNPSDEELDHYSFQTTCDNCHEMQTRVGRDAFKRTVLEWTLNVRSA